VACPRTQDLSDRRSRRRGNGGIDWYSDPRPVPCAHRIGTFFNGAFACDDVQATYRQLSARGVEFVKPPEKQPWGEFAIFKDPDGNQFVMSSN